MKPAAHVLVIRFSAMGDVAMIVPVLLALVKKYPHLKITLVTKPFFAPVFADIPHVTVFKADVKTTYKGFLGLKRLSEELRAKNIDYVADLHNVLRTKVLKFFFRTYKIPVKQINKGRAEKKALTRKKKKVFKQLKATHQRYARVFEELGFPIELPDKIFQEKKILTSQILSNTGGKDKKWLGIAPFAQHEGKTYPPELLKAVLEELQKIDNLKIFLFGGSRAEISLLTQWEKLFPNTVNMAGKVSFEEEIKLISNLDAMVSMDSGNGHLAANFGIPVITVWGVTHPYTGFAPFGQPASNFILPDLEQFPEIPTSVYGNKFPPRYKNAMRSIPPGKIVKKIMEILF